MCDRGVSDRGCSSQGPEMVLEYRDPFQASGATAAKISSDEVQFIAKYHQVTHTIRYVVWHTA